MKLVSLFTKREARQDSVKDRLHLKHSDSQPKSKLKSKSLKAGFTLIELLVVISIIGLLSSTVLGSLTEGRKRANDAKRSQEMAQFKIALEIYFTERGSYPVISQEVSGDSQVLASSDQSKPLDALQNFLSKVTPLANAQSVSDGCNRFDSLASSLLDGKYIGAIPKDPKHNTAAGICYKAWTSSDKNTIAVYTYLEERYQFTEANKKMGFVLSKNSDPSSLTLLRTVCEGTGTDNDDFYPVFDPTGTSGSFCVGPYIADKVVGVTSGVEVASDGTVVGGTGECSDAQYGTQEECEEYVYTCSDGYSGDQTSCESNMCGDGSGAYCTDQYGSMNEYTDEWSCLSETCYNEDPAYCVDAYYNQVGYYDEYSCQNAECFGEWSDDYGNYEYFNCGYQWVGGGGGTEYSCNNWVPESGSSWQCTWDNTGYQRGVWTP